eukprot:2610288-Rhodomonas_salina.3
MQKAGGQSCVHQTDGDDDNVVVGSGGDGGDGGDDHEHGNGDRHGHDGDGDDGDAGGGKPDGSSYLVSVGGNAFLVLILSVLVLVLVHDHHRNSSSEQAILSTPRMPPPPLTWISIPIENTLIPPRVLLLLIIAGSFRHTALQFSIQESSIDTNCVLLELTPLQHLRLTRKVNVPCTPYGQQHCFSRLAALFLMKLPMRLLALPITVKLHFACCTVREVCADLARLFAVRTDPSLLGPNSLRAANLLHYCMRPLLAHGIAAYRHRKVHDHRRFSIKIRHRRAH